MNRWLQRNIDYGYSDDYLADLMDAVNTKLVVPDEYGNSKCLTFENFYGRPVLGKILELRWEDGKNFTYKRHWAAICVGDSRVKNYEEKNWKKHIWVENYPSLNTKNMVDVLELTFTMATRRHIPNDHYDGNGNWIHDGITDLGTKSQNHRQCFVEDHAQKIADFVRKNWNRIDLLLVCTPLGGSRGSAIAKAISDVYHPDLSKHWDIYLPNPMVYEVLTKALAPKD